MQARIRVPVVLTIAGSDSGGGAGIQADLKTFAALKVHGTSAVSCLTAQNPDGVSAIEPCSPAVLQKQIEAIFQAFPIAAVKTGMLFSKELIQSAARTLGSIPRRPPLVIDPVMVATSGATLLKKSAIDALEQMLLPFANLVTPNLDEAAILSGLKLREPEDMRAAARVIHAKWRCAVLIKGGHFKHLTEAIDLFYDGHQELLLRAPYIRGVSTHGTGCTYSAATAAYRALGAEMDSAVQRAKQFVTLAIHRSVLAGRHPVLNQCSDRISK